MFGHSFDCFDSYFIVEEDGTPVVFHTVSWTAWDGLVNTEPTELDRRGLCQWLATWFPKFMGSKWDKTYSEQIHAYPPYDRLPDN